MLARGLDPDEVRADLPADAPERRGQEVFVAQCMPCHTMRGANALVELTRTWTDDQLRLIFTCCHPALSPEARIALTLRLIAGLQTPEVAHAFLVPEATMAQRIVRAKKKIKAAKLPYRVPSATELPERLRPVLAVLYLIFTEGHRASSSEHLVREDLCAEAIRLSRLVCDLMPEEPEAVGLLALMLLTDARAATRVHCRRQLPRDSPYLSAVDSLVFHLPRNTGAIPEAAPPGTTDPASETSLRRDFPRDCGPVREFA